MSCTVRIVTVSSSIPFHKNSWIRSSFISLIKCYDHRLSNCRTATTIYWYWWCITDSGHFISDATRLRKTFLIFYILLECFRRWVDTTGRRRRAWPAFESPLYFLGALEPGSSSVWTLLESMLGSSGSVNTKQKANLQQLLVSLCQC